MLPRPGDHGVRHFLTSQPYSSGSERLPESVWIRQRCLPTLRQPQKKDTSSVGQSSAAKLGSTNTITLLGWGLNILEFSLAGELDEELRGALSQSVPNCLDIATQLSDRLKLHSFNTPRALRAGYVTIIQWIDHYVRTKAGMSKGITLEMLVDPVLSDSEIQIQADHVFHLENPFLNTDHVDLLVKYLPDGGYCYSLSMSPEEVDEWTERVKKVSASEFVASIESLKSEPLV